MSNIRLGVNIYFYDLTLIRIQGEVDAEINFTYGPYQSSHGNNVRVRQSCSAILNNEMYVFGGQFVDRQVNLLNKA